jgi:hypothetical protein
MISNRKELAIWPVLNPLRFARLAGDQCDRVCRRRGILGRENIIEENKPAGILPKERNGVAIDVRHHEPGELRSLRFIRGAAPPRVTAIFVRCELIHSRDIGGDVHFARQPDMAVIDAVDGVCILIGSNQERLDGHRLAACEIFIGLGEARRILGRTRMLAVRVNPIRPWKRPKIIIERLVFFEDHKNIFHRRAETFDRLFPGKARLRALHPVSVKRQHIGTRIGLQGHGWNVPFLCQPHRRDAKLRRSRRNQGGTRIKKKSNHAPPKFLWPKQAEVCQFPRLTMLG